MYALRIMIFTIFMFFIIIYYYIYHLITSSSAIIYIISATVPIRCELLTYCEICFLWHR